MQSSLTQLVFSRHQILTVMRLKVKCLSSAVVEIEADPGDTVLALKQKLELEIGKPASSLKLIKLGKILVNDATVETTGLKEGDQLVLMVEHAKPAPHPVAPAEPEKPAVQQTSAQDYVPESELVLAPTAPVTVSQAALAQLLDLGFPYDQCEKALRVAQGDVSGAIELLMTREDSSDPIEAFDINSEEIQELIRKPEFLQLRELLIARPQLLGQVLEQIEMSNPRLALLIARFPEDFKRLLTSPLPVNTEPEPAVVPAAEPVELTPEQRTDVDSLVAFGFAYATALEVYLNCGKNVDVAASYLFENYKPA